MTVLGVVTARAGSKGIPGKNTRLLGGEPLIAHTIAAARESGVFDRLIISTDDERAALVAKERGCEVPFMRPAELAADDTPHLPVMQHALSWLRDREGYAPDWVMILLPTSPFRRAADIRGAVERARTTGCDSVVGVGELPPHFHPMRVVTIDAGGMAVLFDGTPVKRRPNRRQEMTPAWVLNGAIYLLRTALLFDPAEPSLYGDRVAAYPMPDPYGFNIDDPADWDEAERMLGAGIAR